MPSPKALLHGTTNQPTPIMKNQHDGRRPTSHHRNQPLRPYENPHCQVYVIELDESVATDPVFRKANPRYVPGSPCYYVGMTSLTPEERFRQHVDGTRNSSRIAAFGLRLRMDLVANKKPVRRTWAMERERSLARALRSGGCGAWQA